MSLRSEGKGLLVVALNEYASRHDNPHVPYTAEQVAADALECADAGASVVHVHSRNDDGSPLMPGADYYRRVIELVAPESDVLVWPTAPPLGGDVTSAGELSHVWDLDDDPPRPGVLALAPFDLFRMGPPPYWDEGRARLLQSPAESARGGVGEYEPPGALTEIVRRGLTPVFCCFDLTDVRWTSHVVRAGYAPEPALVLVEFLGHYLMSGSPTVANLDGTLAEWRDDVDVELVVAAQMVDDRQDYERLLLHGLARGMGLRVGIGDAPDLYPDARNVDMVRWGVDRLADVGLEPARPGRRRPVRHYDPHDLTPEVCEMSENSQRWLADRAAVTDVLHRYTLGVDTMDVHLTASCFTPDCRYEIGENEVVVGRPTLIEFLADKTGIRKRETGLDGVHVFTHVMSNIMMELDGDRADVQSIVTAYVIGTRDDTRVMLVRCVRYYDEMARDGDEWLIARRRHVFQWMYETTPTAFHS